MTCAACGAELARRERIGRRDRCQGCGVDLRCCRQCRFYDPTLADQCREPQAERVTDKTAANFCDFFALADAAVATPSPASSTSARDALERLFRR